VPCTGTAAAGMDVTVQSNLEASGVTEQVFTIATQALSIQF